MRNTIADERIQEQATANASADQFADGDFRAVLADAVVRTLSSHHSMSEQMLQNPKVFDEVAETLLPEIYARARAAAAQRGDTDTIWARHRLDLQPPWG